MKSRIIWFIPAILVALGILALSTFLSISVPVEGVSYLDKWQHTFAYMVLSLSFLTALYKSNTLTKNWSLMILLGASSYGLSLEFVQYQFFANRYFEWLDAIANVLGAILGFGIFHVLIRRF